MQLLHMQRHLSQVTNSRRNTNTVPTPILPADVNTILLNFFEQLSRLHLENA